MTELKKSQSLGKRMADGQVRGIGCIRGTDQPAHSLKTLKDLRKKEINSSIHPEWTNDHELKAEAIKWIKVIKENTDNSDTDFILIDWIEEFFNLTEDDLK